MNNYYNLEEEKERISDLMLNNISNLIADESSSFGNLKNEIRGVVNERFDINPENLLDLFKIGIKIQADRIYADPSCTLKGIVSDTCSIESVINNALEKISDDIYQNIVSNFSIKIIGQYKPID